MQIILTPDLILAAYRQGLFPMARSAHTSEINWICPAQRGQLSIIKLHISRSLSKLLRHMTIPSGAYDIRINHDFCDVIESCAQERPERPETWINKEIIDVFCALHDLGHAHSVECWQGGRMVGGLYGISIGGAFFGESMFSRATDASKVCLVHLAARLWACGYTLLDTQFVNDHLLQFGAHEVTYKNYLSQLHEALEIRPKSFDAALYSEQDLIMLYLSMQKSRED